MQDNIAIIETGRPLKNARGGGSINSLLMLARYYCNSGKGVHLVFRHFTIVDVDQLPQGVKVDYLLGPIGNDKNQRSDGNNKNYIKGKTREVLSTFLRLKETYRIYKILRKNKNLTTIHLNNRLLPNTHLIWLKPLLGVRLVQHQRQYDNFLLYPSWLYNFFIDQVLCVSDDVKFNTQRLGIHKAKRLYNSCISHKGASTYDLEIVTYNFLWIGRIVPWKGLHELPTILNGVNCRLHIYGSSDETSTYSTGVFRLLNERGIDFELHGYVPSSEIFSKQYKNTFLIHSTIEPEPFGRVIVEAMSIGMIPVSFGKGGSRELIDDQINGIIIAPRQSISSHLGNLMYNWSIMSTKAKEKFQGQYCSEVHYARLKELLCVE